MGYALSIDVNREYNFLSVIGIPICRMCNRFGVGHLVLRIFSRYAQGIANPDHQLSALCPRHDYKTALLDKTVFGECIVLFFIYAYYSDGPKIRRRDTFLLHQRRE